MSDCLWASSWLTKDHADFKRMAMNNSFPRTQDLIQSVQQTNENTDRTQRCTIYANTARLEHISLVKKEIE